LACPLCAISELIANRFKLSFRFIADWKAHGELNLGVDDTATGFINQKDHITELRCKIHRK